MVPAKNWKVAAKIDRMLAEKWTNLSDIPIVNASGRKCQTLHGAFGMLYRAVEVCPVADAVEVRAIRGSALHQALVDVLPQAIDKVPIRVVEVKSIR